MKDIMEVSNQKILFGIKWVTKFVIGNHNVKTLQLKIWYNAKLLQIILGLTGLNKAETAAKHGEEQVKIWRRSFDTPPPAMDLIHPYYNIIVNDPR